MTIKERVILDDSFEQLLIKMVVSYLKLEHFTEYKIKFDTGEKVKEIYEISINKIMEGGKHWTN